MARKWFMLVSYCALIFANGFAFSSLAPITNEAEDYFDKSAGEINFLVEIFYVFYIPLAPFASWLLTKSLHHCLILSWVLTLIGMWVKYIGGANFWVALLGQGILSTATPLILTAISSLTAVWFPPHQSLFATTVGELFTFIGIGTAFLLAPTMPIHTNFLMQAIVVSVFTLIYIVFGKKDKHTPANLTLKHFFEETKTLVLDCGHLALVLAVSYLTGLAYSLLGILGEALGDEGLSEFQSSIIGFSMAITGLGGGLTVAFIEHYEVSPLKVVPIFCLGGISMSALWALLIEEVWANYFFGAVLAYFFFGLIPLGLRLSITYDKEVIETIPSGLIFLLAQLYALVFTYALLDLTVIGLHPLWVLTALLFVGCLFLIGTMCKYRNKLVPDIGKPLHEHIKFGITDEVDSN